MTGEGRGREGGSRLDARASPLGRIPLIRRVGERRIGFIKNTQSPRGVETGVERGLGDAAAFVLQRRKLARARRALTRHVARAHVLFRYVTRLTRRGRCEDGEGRVSVWISAMQRVAGCAVSAPALAARPATR